MRLDREDLIGALGLSILVGGIYWIYRPAALIVLGAILIAYALILGRKPRPIEAPREESE